MKTKKEKILLTALIALFVVLFVLLYFWTVSIAKEDGNNMLGLITGVTYFTMLYINSLYVKEQNKRIVQQATDKIMDMIIEWSKENKKITMEVEEGLGKTKRKNRSYD